MACRHDLHLPTLSVWHRICAVILLALLILPLTGGLALAVSVEQVTNPRPRGSWVSDHAGILDSSTEWRLNSIINRAERELGVEIAVVTVPSVNSPTPKDFATRLFNHWGIGKKNNNGLLVLMVMDRRRLEMETGYGTEAVLTDGWLKSMQVEVMVPRFRAGDYGGGLIDGVQKCINRMHKYPDGIGAPSSYGELGDDERRNLILLVTGTLLGGSTLIGGFGYLRYRRNRTCTNCQVRLEMVPDHEDEAQLEAGQQTEERLGSVDYQLYFCTGCDFTKVITRKPWISSYSRCSQCGYRTSRSTTRTVASSTYESSGVVEVTAHCAHCKQSYTTRRRLPRLARIESSSSSSGSSGGYSSGSSGGYSSGSSGGGYSGGSSSGGSFGGGSSGGGGAGSSW